MSSKASTLPPISTANQAIPINQTKLDPPREQEAHQFSPRSPKSPNDPNAPSSSDNPHKKSKNKKKSTTYKFALPIINGMLCGVTIWNNIIYGLYPVFSKFLYERISVPPFALLFISHIFTFSVAIPMLFDRIRFSIMEMRRISSEKLNMLKPATKKHAHANSCSFFWKIITKFIMKLIAQMIYCLDIWLYLVLKCIRLAFQVYASTQTNPEYLVMFELFVPFFSGLLLDGIIFPFLNCVPRYERKVLKPNYEGIIKGIREDVVSKQDQAEQKEITNENLIETKQQPEPHETEGEGVMHDDDSSDVLQEELEVRKIKEIDADINKTAEIVLEKLNADAKIEVSRVKGTFSFPKFPFLNEFKLHVLIITIISLIICALSFSFVVISGTSFNIYKTSPSQHYTWTWLIDFTALANYGILTREDLIGLSMAFGSAVLLFVFFFILKTRELRSNFFQAQHQARIDAAKARETVSKLENQFKHELEHNVRQKHVSLLASEVNINDQSESDEEIEMSHAGMSLLSQHAEDVEEDEEKIDQNKIINQTISEIVAALPNFTCSGANLYIASCLLFPPFYLIPSLLILGEDWRPILTNIWAVVLCGVFGIVCYTQSTIFTLIMNNEYHPFINIDPRTRWLCGIINIGRIEWLGMGLRVLVCWLLMFLIFGYAYFNALQIAAAVVFFVSLMAFLVVHRE